MTKAYGEVLDEMDHQAKYQSATIDPYREQELRIQALGAAISRRDWHATERAYEAIRDKHVATTLPTAKAAVVADTITLCEELARMAEFVENKKIQQKIYRTVHQLQLLEQLAKDQP